MPLRDQQLYGDWFFRCCFLIDFSQLVFGLVVAQGSTNDFSMAPNRETTMPDAVKEHNTTNSVQHKTYTYIYMYIYIYICTYIYIFL